MANNGDLTCDCIKGSSQLRNNHNLQTSADGITAGMSNCDPEMKQKALRLCQQFLSGAWKNLSCSDIIVKRFSGGLSNLLYFCALPSSVAPQDVEPRHVLLRIYGQSHDDAVGAVITQSVIFMQLSAHCLGPQLYGVFPGGRIEEFIPARAMTTAELSDSDLSGLIAERLAKIHTMQVPIIKEPTWLPETMTRWLQFIRKNVNLIGKSKEDVPKVKKLIAYNLEKEYEWLMTVIRKCNSPVVFSHNDLQEGNILISDNTPLSEDRLTFIDFEYCSYNYRGFDLANHFCEWCYNYTNPSPPYFYVDLKDYPTREQQLHFIRLYVSRLPEDFLLRITGESLPTKGRALEEAILKEVATFTMVSHFFWSLWGIVNGQSTEIEFGYWDYSLTRLDAYFQQKRKLLHTLQ